MEETTTPEPVRVVGQPADHPSIRRLARACLDLARWQRRHQSASRHTGQAAPTPPTTSSRSVS